MNRKIAAAAAIFLLLSACGSNTESDGGGLSSLSMEDLMSANDVLTLLEDHSSICYETESVLGDQPAGEQTTWVYRNDSGLCVYSVMYDSAEAAQSGVPSGQSYSYIGESVPGATYSTYAITENGMQTTDKVLTLCASNEYEMLQAYASYLFVGAGLENVASSSEKDGQIVVKTETETKAAGDTEISSTYVVAPDTLLVSSAETKMNISGAEVTTKTTVTYDGEHAEPSPDPRAQIVNVEGACDLTVMINPLQGNAETQKFMVGKDVEVMFSSIGGCQYFSDKACTHEINRIDVTGDTATVYVKLA